MFCVVCDMLIEACIIMSHIFSHTYGGGGGGGGRNTPHMKAEYT